jgi:hypothetical protein
MKKTGRVAMAIIVLWVSASPSSAEREFWMGTAPPPRTVRVKQALEWLEGFKRLNQQIPTLSPREQEWLEREYDNQVGPGRFTPRARAAFDSPEYQKRLARERLDQILFALGVLVNAEQLTTATEVQAWAELASGMMDPQLWQSVTVLVERKSVSPEINGVKQFYLENHVAWAQGVLNRVVVPYLAGRLK